MSENKNESILCDLIDRRKTHFMSGKISLLSVRLMNKGITCVRNMNSNESN